MAILAAITIAYFVYLFVFQMVLLYRVHAIQRRIEEQSLAHSRESQPLVAAIHWHKLAVRALAWNPGFFLENTRAVICIEEAEACLDDLD